MAKPGKKKERLSIDMQPEEHTLIKMYAARKGISIRIFVLDCIRKRLSEEDETKALESMTSDAGPVLKKLWDNAKDAAYDNG